MQPSFLRGVGKHLYYVWTIRAKKPDLIAYEIEARFGDNAAYLFEGVGMGWAEQEFIWRIAPRSWYWKAFTKDLSEESKSSILKGKESIHATLM